MKMLRLGQHPVKCPGMSWPGGMFKCTLFGRFEDLPRTGIWDERWVVM